MIIITVWFVKKEKAHHSHLAGLLGVAPRVCRELASMSMMVLRSRTGGGRAALQMVITQSHILP